MKKVTEEKSMRKPREKKFTMAEAMKKVNEDNQKVGAERQARLQEATMLIEAALKKTKCSLRVNPESALNNLQIIIALDD